MVNFICLINWKKIRISSTSLKAGIGSRVSIGAPGQFNNNSSRVS